MDKLHILITGRRNSGKSSLINALTGQKIAIVSDIPGTTTDPVKKSFEIPGFASVIFVDTAGIDDEGELGKQRVNKTFEQLPRADIAILVITANRFEREEELLAERFSSLRLPFLILHNKADLSPLNPVLQTSLESQYRVPVIDFSAYDNKTVPGLLDALRRIAKISNPSPLLEGLVNPQDIVMLITPIDSEVPVGRLILPQVQAIRDILDKHCISVVLQPEEISHFLSTTGIIPKLVVTDRQVFKKVATLIPADIPLTSFSILLARQKGCFQKYLEGTQYIRHLQDNDTILMLESCSHHVSCEDIGRVKLPNLLRQYSGKQLNFEFISGLDPITHPLNTYALVIQCGGCMVTHTQLKNRLLPFIEAGIPVSNYGMAIAFLSGIFDRTIAPLKK